ncbi:BNR-4 repeat-containing protein [Neiella sp. HB171785]|uniref:BNR-4 repeat-containing protein n=1 Tax=Neiella litorisoli TaxID=2771431 RepID=A0A8J6QG37_9GAMM|nr:BNR-4 repeat-containing protein [Neiella litorisoli]MBD1388670.1 BNR-4 repeat-containing protein [Neiella litorisoli]
MNNKSYPIQGVTKLAAGCCASLLLMASTGANAAVTLESTTKIADNALHFDGYDIDSSTFKNQNLSTQEQQDDSRYHYKFGGSISAHGDAVKIYKHYVFMTWYRGGKDDRHVMLSRLNTKTGSVKTIEFPHQHTGYQGRWWIGESHNTIGLAVSPINGTIHMVYDMHAYGDKSVPDNKYGDLEKYPDEPFLNDYFRYSYSLAGAAEVADEDFTLVKQFVPDTSEVSEGPDDYKHLVMTGDLDDKLNFSAFTYPKFFETTEDDLLLYMRWGGNNNGAYYYNKYDASAETWSRFDPFNHKDQKSHGLDHNWGLYGNMKYFNGKLRVGFQRRSSNNNDKYIYQNGIYYAYLDDPATNLWRDHTGKQITWPLVDADEIKVFEPGDLVKTEDTSANGAGTPPGKVYIVGGFDWAMTDKGDLHFIHKVQDREFNQTVYGHLYKPAGATEFIHADGIPGAESIYAAGDDIYIIGLRDKKPYVQKAVGGTTKFEEVYSDTTTTINFQHGTAYIKDGKVYYYLMEAKSGTARPLHLQVIDLGIAKATVSLDLSEPTIVQGYDALSVTAEVSTLSNNTSIESVALYIGDTLVSTLDAAPYQWSQADAALQNLAPGSYQLKVVATDDGNTSSEALATLTVLDPTPTIAVTEAPASLTEGYQNLSFGVEASSPIAGRAIAEVTLFVNGSEVSSKTAAPYQWTQAESLLATLAVGAHTFKAVVTDSEGDSAEATMTIRVTAKPAEGGSPSAGGSGGGGGSMNPFGLLMLALLGLRRVGQNKAE